MGVLFQIAMSGCGSGPRYSYGRDDLAGSGSFYRVRRDVRRCASPLCGGYFVALLNQGTTPCRDGTSQAECYVAEADWTRLGPEGSALERFRNALLAGTAVVRADVAPRTYGDFGDLGVLVVGEAWEAATATPPSGTFYRVYDTGLRCGTTPCFSLRADVLDAGDALYLSGLDLGPVRAPQEQVNLAEERLRLSAILVAGTPRAVSGSGADSAGYQLTAAQFYLRTLGNPATACGGITGGACPGRQICDVTLRGACGGADLPGVCVAAPDACAEIYQPVCGCDGRTYGNDCERLRARVQIDHEGPCGEGRACGGFQGGGCPDGQFCDITIPQACRGTDLSGICRVVGEVCFEISQPVCGCDGQTYANDCFRRVARVQLDHEGPCP
ncbi:MAG TPA: Kazal-type serine protease inhibitor family protein [Polyangia bacterium]|nr:Kazal-type serine protease inhibitor family protein [Polyangia bacterium]